MTQNLIKILMCFPQETRCLGFEMVLGLFCCRMISVLLALCGSDNAIESLGIYLHVFPFYSSANISKALSQCLRICAWNNDILENSIGDRL